MIRKFTGLILSLSLVGGCMSNDVINQKWEYKRITIDPLKGQHFLVAVMKGENFSKYNEKVESPLNKLGLEGWEVVGLTGNVYILKRRLNR